MKDNSIDQLASYVDALHPIIYINHFDFPEVDKMIDSIKENHSCFEFSNSQGRVDFKTKASKQKCDLVNFLEDSDLNFAIL